MSLTVTEEHGLELPDEYRDTEKIVIRTPKTTQNIRKGFQMMVTDGYFPTVVPSNFDVSEEDADNPNLLPNKVSLKAYGEDTEEFEVEI